MAEEPSTQRHTPKYGYVPNEATAIAIAVAVWIPIYGAGPIANQKPYTAELVGNTWIVKGSLPKQKVGGVARAEIAKHDGRILSVTHGK